MRYFLKQIIIHTPFYHPLRNLLVRRRQAREHAIWEGAGHSGPAPHLIKQTTLRIHAKQYGLKVLVETGTFDGDMVEAMKKVFDKIYSIELSKPLYEKAKKRFRRKKHIELIHGDSGKEMKRVVDRINLAALFWLDGHYSGGVTAKGETDTPILEELHHILGGEDRGHVIIIDDARCFGSDPAYPTMKQLCDFVRSIRENVEILVKDDSIRITPKLLPSDNA